MDKLFLQIINMSITSSYVILFIVLIRFLLKKAPKIFSYCLWGIAFFRLIFPFSFESIFSLIAINTETIPENIVYTQAPQIQSGITLIDSTVNRAMPTSVAGASVNPMQIWISVGSSIWLTGIVVLLAYSIFTTIKLSKKLKTSTHIYENIYKIETMKTPFVFGLINPKIYLPNNLSKTEVSYIIKHEQTHIKRKDHIIKFVAFLIVTIHWFNPMVWIAFYLMGEDMELSCDESVIKKMGYEIKRDYSNSLLSLSIGRRIVGGSPIAFGENNTKSRIKNILNYKQPKFVVVIVVIAIIVALGIGLLSNPPSSTTNNSPNEEMTIEDYAWKFIDNEIEMYENAEWGDVKFVDKKITKLEKLSSFDNILSSPVELWRLEYRIKPDNIEKVVIAGGMQVEDGWLTEDSSMGKPNLVFTYEDGSLIYLGNANTIEFDMNTLSSQEIAIRIMLENMGLLTNETYNGNHVIIKFPLSTGEISQLLLSQPVKQDNTGIWAVESWMDGNGNIYHDVPIYEEDMEIQDYYIKLQEEVDSGHKPWVLDPIEVGYDYIFNYLGQILVKRADLEVINPATIDDFLITPESHFIGYITMMTKDERLFHLDKVEFLTLEDEERAAELGIDMDNEMPSGFMVYNPDTYPSAFDVSDDTEYLLLNWSDLSKHTSVTKEEFIKYNESLDYNLLYHIYTKDGYVTLIKEQYIP
ncbi:MAG: M56 family metallopeptidase [Tissierellaceae bacterium]|nr:M56 family metallopeptidase [Tissierellaceae bacterium]